MGRSRNRLYRTAQGFNPGLPQREIRPASGGRGEFLGVGVYSNTAKRRVPLSGHLLLTNGPRAKALGLEFGPN